VQLARRVGLRTIATASAEDASFVRHLGAQVVIDFKSQRFEEQVREADAVIDLVGSDTQTRSFQVLRRGGKLISAVSSPDQQLAARYSVEVAFFLVDVSTQRLSQIADLIDSRELSVRVGEVIAFADAPKAHLMLENVLPRPKGKIVLNVGTRQVTS
jgi:NADPH:quinone reductase-like Zn-dependent oxidoreductase